MSIISKVIVASSLVALGTGLVYVIYQRYVFTERESKLESQISHLSLKLAKLEEELQKIKENLTLSSSTEENEEIFIDALEVAATPLTVNEQGDIPGDVPTCIQSDETFCAAKKVDENTYVLLIKIDSLVEEGGYDNMKEAFNLLTDLTEKHPLESEFQWRLAKVCFLLTSEDMIKNSETISSTQTDLMKTAHDAAKRALELNDKSGDAHKWMAIVIGSITQYLPVQEQIKNAYVIKDHIQAAMKYKPNDFLPYHMMGRWCYSVYMLTWVERKVAATLFAAPPTATIEEAIEYLLKAEEKNPGSSIDNVLYLGKAYLAKRDYIKAVMWWKSGLQMTSSKTDDIKALKEIEDLLTQYESYAQS
ncbi:regulator of microtubule dynamics protein 1-like isoform X3 [Biomphalaria pfeifferi]|uniref:Regulator of microtubule dynamics protein 1-like isoform X3 n=1 Tax=Biomphalaria pfeifferi TaxID=112525 RepID=A0AAD8ATV2_BIOPF|nr:regulator of microtubule dynamics protein 1-like isoform X3 [Biomphalaria pfeifferi]